MATSSYAELAEIVRSFQQRLAGEWRRMTEPEWRGDSACEGWTPAHIAAHLAFQGNFYVANLARALNGLQGPPFVFGPRGPEDYSAYRDGLIDEWAAWQPERLITEYETWSAVLVELAARLSTSERQMTSWWLRGEMPLGQFLEFRLFELSIHDWDIRSGVDPRAEIRAEILPTLVPLIRSRLPQFAGPKPGERASGRIRLTVERVAPVRWDITIDDAGLRIDDAGRAAPDATIVAEPSALALVVAGRVAAAEAGSDWQVDGDQENGAAFGRLFRGF